MRGTLPFPAAEEYWGTRPTRDAPHKIQVGRAVTTGCLLREMRRAYYSTSGVAPKAAGNGTRALEPDGAKRDGAAEEEIAMGRFEHPIFGL